MKVVRMRTLVLALFATAIVAGCASTQNRGDDDNNRPDRLNREQILGAEATNLYDVVNRLRPRWLQVRSTRSFNMQTLIAVMQDDMYLGAAEMLREMTPDLAFGMRYVDGPRAASMLPSLMSGQHVEALIIVSTRGREGGGR